MFERGSGAALDTWLSSKSKGKGGGFFEFSSLPDAEKIRLCEGLLAEVGARNVKVQKTGEIIHSCVLPFGGHAHGDANASASLNWKKLTYNCFQASTRIITRSGVREIGDLAGGFHELLDGDGKWTKSEVRRFGVDRLWKLVVSRNGVLKEIYATGNHRWLRRGGRDRKKLIETTTDQLRVGHRLPSVYPFRSASKLMPLGFGVAHGFVFGDGTAMDDCSVAYFAPGKDEVMLSYFPGQTPTVRRDGMIRIGRLPKFFRDPPPLDEAPSYLYGWLAGYFAADGCVSEDGEVTLVSSSRKTLEFVRDVCTRLGIGTFAIREQRRLGFGINPSSIFSLGFVASTLTNEFFLMPQHRNRYELTKDRFVRERLGWSVVSVEETDRVEDVFCAIVPGTHSFVLEDNLQTLNCFGCGNSGGLLWFIAVVRGLESTEARRWLAEQTGIGGVQDLDSILRFIDAAIEFSHKGYEALPIPRYDPRILEPWKLIHPYLTEERHIPVANIVKHTVGFDGERIIIPHFWKGNLVGWQARRLFHTDSGPKYKNTPDFPRDSTVFNYDPAQERVVIVESPMSVLARSHQCHVEATFGAELSEGQLRALSNHRDIVVFMDPDKAGWKGTRVLCEYLSQHTSRLRVVQNPWAGADAADVDDETFERLVAGAVHWTLWSPPDPGSLIEWRGREEVRNGEGAQG